MKRDIEKGKIFVETFDDIKSTSVHENCLNYHKVH